MFIGRLKNFKTGTIVQFKIVKITKKRRAAEIFSTVKFFRVFDNKNKIRVLMVKNKAASIIKIKLRF